MSLRILGGEEQPSHFQNWRRQGIIDAVFQLADTIQEVALPERTCSAVIKDWLRSFEEIVARDGMSGLISRGTFLDETEETVEVLHSLFGLIQM